MIFDMIEGVVKTVRKFTANITRSDISTPPNFNKNGELLTTADWLNNKERHDRIDLIQRMILDVNLGRDIEFLATDKSAPGHSPGTMFRVKYGANLWYHGAIKNGSGRPEGYGEITYKSAAGVVFCVSFFRDGFFWYDGCIFFENGDKWRGIWERNNPLDFQGVYYNSTPYYFLNE